MEKLDLACGLNLMKPLEDWIHLDIHEGPHIEIVCDFKYMPLIDKSIDWIHAGDCIEHIENWNLDQTLREWNRVLKIGGVFEGTTPNLDNAIRSYIGGRIDYNWLIQNLYGDRESYLLYTAEELNKVLIKYGFDEVDFSGSPGIGSEYGMWWLVFKTTKVRDV
jgi:predicted SAM-dependent methyltransferase